MHFEIKNIKKFYVFIELIELNWKGLSNYLTWNNSAISDLNQK